MTHVAVCQGEPLHRDAAVAFRPSPPREAEILRPLAQVARLLEHPGAGGGVDVARPQGLLHDAHVSSEAVPHRDEVLPLLVLLAAYLLDVSREPVLPGLERVKQCATVLEVAGREGERGGYL